LKDEYTDLVKAGIIDPTKVTRSALQNAASVSTLLLTSDALIADIPKEEKPAPGGGHGGYDDMLLSWIPATISQGGMPRTAASRLLSLTKPRKAIEWKGEFLNF
jgi:hypothetical protein